MHISGNNKVVIGLSGGVDSSVAASLLIEQGYEVEALFMKNWEEDDDGGYCAAEQDIADATAVCERLGIPLHTVNFASEYWDNVFEHFLEALKHGLTPNPDILCNKEIKFKVFLEYAKNLGASKIATGHYTQVRQATNDHWLLTKGLDPFKDQSYFLYTLGQAQLSQSLFPIGTHHKSWVRQYAKERDLITHNKKDSTGICFIGEKRFKNFLKTYLPAKPGHIITTSNEVIGEHEGLMYYTLGQRKGLAIGGRKSGSGEPWFVTEKRLEDNSLVVVQGEDNPLLFKRSLFAINCDFPHEGVLNTLLTNSNITAKTRYRQEDVPVSEIQQTQSGQLKVTFSEPQRAITPGQSVVFYQGDDCLGGGIIAGSEN